jgi:hypothetical protein
VLERGKDGIGQARRKGILVWAVIFRCASDAGLLRVRERGWHGTGLVYLRAFAAIPIRGLRGVSV